jgi:hypothetical protein
MPEVAKKIIDISVTYWLYWWGGNDNGGNFGKLSKL